MRRNKSLKFCVFRVSPKVNRLRWYSRFPKLGFSLKALYNLDNVGQGNKIGVIMAEKNYDEQDNTLIAIAALASVSSDGKTRDEWLHDVGTRAAFLKSSHLIGENGLLSKIVSSVRIPARIKSIEFEESSQRYLIKFVALYEGSEEETIRTSRMDHKDGQIIRKDIEKMQKEYVGTDKVVVIYKNNYKPSENSKATNDRKIVPANGYRCAVWFDFNSR